MSEHATALQMLIVEDDPSNGMALQDYFELQGYEVTLVETGAAALEHLLENPSLKIAILDLGLPDQDGFTVLKTARERGVSTPFLVLTGTGGKEAMLTGFGLGADDYVTKPFSPEELAARVKAILMRTLPPAEAPMEIFQLGDISINFTTHKAFRGDTEISFTALEFDILRYLIQHRGRTVTRKQLLRDVWGIPQDIITRTIDRHIASVRKKVEPDPAVPTYIETVYGIGYRLNIPDSDG